MKHLRLVALAGVLMVTIAACGTEASPPATTEAAMTGDTGDMHMDETTTDGEMHMDEGDDHGEHTFAFGEPADPADADRVIDIEALDTLKFDPASIEVKAGETVTFRITNAGNIPHDVVLADQAGQDQHEEEMQAMIAEGMTMMADEPNGFALAPGETKEMTFHFTEPAEVFLGCHQPGHYAAGMIAEVHVEG